MKTLTTLLIFVCIFSFGTTINAQEEENETNLYCFEEIVLPEKIDEYWQLAKELLELCKENDFPYSFYTWTTGDFKYQLWSPLNSLDDIDKINEAWEALLKDWDEEKMVAFSKSKIKNYSYTITLKPSLNYQPENPRLSDEEALYCYWQEFYLITGKEKEAEAIVKEATDILRSKNYGDSWTFAYGGIGFETPCLIGWTIGRDRQDYWEQDKKFNEMYAEDFKEINKKFTSCIRTKISKDMWFIKELSYVRE